MGSRWASWTGKHPRNPNPSQGLLARSLGLGAGMLQRVAAWLSHSRVACFKLVPVGLGCPETPGVLAASAPCPG